MSIPTFLSIWSKRLYRSLADRTTSAVPIGPLGSATRHFTHSALVASHFDVEHLVIGAGVVGLAVARALSHFGPTLVLERHSGFGQETSSRNSEVVHAGLYYPLESLKTRLCVRGNAELYEFCERQGVPFQRTGKWIVAVDAAEAQYLKRLKEKADILGVPTYWLDVDAAMELEPIVRPTAILVSPSSGIIDSHALLSSLEAAIIDNGSDVVYRTSVRHISFAKDSYTVTAETEHSSGAITMQVKAVVNAAGLHGDEIASMLPFPSEYLSSLRVYPVKGTYYRLRRAPRISRLIYPVPPNPDSLSTGLGVHCTVDMGGQAKFGPDAFMVASKNDVNVDSCPQSARHAVAAALNRYLWIPGDKWTAEDVEPSYAGVRPKLSPIGGEFRDFVICEESKHNFPGFVNLIGIESPGLTSSLAIARFVAALLHPR